MPDSTKKLVAVAAAVTLILSGCGRPPSKTDQAARLLAPAQVDTSDGLRIDGELVADRQLFAAAKKSKVVFYSAAGKEAEDLTVARFTAETGIKVELTRLPNNKLAERALSENGAGKLTADAIRLTDPRVARKFEQAGVYAPYRTPFHGLLEKQGSLTSGAFFTGYYFVNAVGYNSALVTDPPTQWTDLLDPRFKGELGMVAITTGGTLNALTRFQLETFGPQFLQREAQQKPRIFNSTSTHVDALARGEISIGPVSFNNAFAAEVAGAPIKLLVPEDGVSASQGPLGLTKKGTANPAAEVFANWSLSRSGQRFVGAQGFVPVRTDIAPVKTGDYQLPPANSPKFHLLTEAGFAQYARSDEQLWKDTFGFIG